MIPISSSSLFSRFEADLALAAERGRYEAAVLRRYGGTLTREDAEDVVSDALVTSAHRCPATDIEHARAWFTCVVINRAEDLRRSRYGRPRSARGRDADGRAAARSYVSLDDCAEARQLACDRPQPGEVVEEKLRRSAARESVRRAFAQMDPLLVQVLRERHIARDGEPASRAEAAAALDLTVSRYERLYTRARKAFMEASTGG